MCLYLFFHFIAFMVSRGVHAFIERSLVFFLYNYCRYLITLLFVELQSTSCILGGPAYYCMVQRSAPILGKGQSLILYLYLKSHRR